MMSQTGSSSSKNKLPIPKVYWHIPCDMTDVMPLEDACRTFFYSRNALLRRIKMGRLVGFKIGHRWFLKVDKL